MKKLILLIFLIQSFICNAQFFIGNTGRQVKKVLAEKKIDFTEDFLSEKTTRISWLKKDDFQMIWVLDINDKVIRQTLISENENGINNFVKWFNKDFVVISPTKWRNYSRNLIYDIEPENLFGEYIFTITIK